MLWPYDALPAKHQAVRVQQPARLRLCLERLAVPEQAPALGRCIVERKGVMPGALGSPSSMVLACDAGGTKTNLALFEGMGCALELVRLETYRSQDHRSLEEIVTRFLGDPTPRLEAAGFGVPGPVVAGRVHTTNLPWVVDGGRLAQLVGLPSVALLNDLEGHAWAVERLAPADVVILQDGPPAPGNVAVIAAGTGLGLSALVRGPTATLSLASEGGHADFAPGDELETELLRRLRARFGHVSVERVLSGPGLLEIYEFLRDRDGQMEPDWLTAAIANGDPSAAVAEAGIAGRCSVCEQAVLRFLRIYGAEAGNWALRVLAFGGVYLGGGIAGKLLCGSGAQEGWLARGRAAFLAGFLEKGRSRRMLEGVAVRVIVNDKAALLGVAQYAMEAGAARAA